jgi:DNA-directed RNA polymerase specialized sigma24 family protein
MSCGVPPQCLDDFVSSVAVTALERIQGGAFRVDPEKTLRGSMRAWLTGIVRFRAKDVRRKVTFRGRIVVPGPTEEHPVDVDVAVPSPEGQILAREELAALGRMKMSAKQREAVRLTGLGYSAREIGLILRVPEETAATYIKRLRKAWERAKGKRRRPT